MFCKYKRLLNFLIYGIFSSFLFITLFGCGTSRKKMKPRIETIHHEVKEKPRVKYEGSLWQDNGPLSELFINPKARRVGDIVTISIVESSSAKNNATTGTSRASSLTAGIEKFFNLGDKYREKNYRKLPEYFDPFQKVAVKGSLESGFKGDGATSREGTLTAYITARVIEILPNGNMMIVGSREIMVNNETQFITLSGIIRPRDISPDNVILSTSISDARIAYSGIGVINDRQRPGWLANILNRIWPF
ncbi:MAG: flagellar basal body L-ring protein FlgH [Deltaproteobacteria bacterium]|nr:flagellar basal body L-ring protein FlgH [Deltaproteobacteria bacterium]MBW1737245.1 flagellar basal body L-ring protein FlgH [Deltaproteobacteria bacterium]MBW1908141.1 flagellar basal body L-ring protein FlgH [Deltaproteobacteria bacterium]MBW2032220.1 flagellar basal body L-ring protein FlgH [Deltaproteobacteria bacterium]MBW2113794.1 flagellar basal body L-ring protein FlgH [Deltaproteobacteria bacterium]